jgi:predicted  nucleic acid-binding Zn-ribbon protein
VVENGKKDIAALRAKLEQQQNDYDSLKMARMIEITDGNLDGAKERLSKLIRDVNKCIAILSDEK